MRKVDPVKHAAKRREILGAAGRCFLRSGFRSASIADICVEAGISPGHLYHYFEGKEAIIAAMIETDLSAAQALDHTHDTDTVGWLVLELDRRAKVGRRGSGLMFDVFGEASRSPAIAKILRHHAAVTRARIASQLRRGQTNGTVDPKLDPDETATLVLGVLDAAKALAVRGLRPDRRLFERMLRRFLEAAPTRRAPAKKGR
jgi:AcrR family transcriptional regulator